MDIAEDQYKKWSPAAQEKAAARLRELKPGGWKPFYCPRQGCDGNHHIAAETNVCRANGRLHEWEKIKGHWVCMSKDADGNPSCMMRGVPMDAWVFRHARWNQHPPPGDWLTWLNRGGRGSGKTRTGAEWINRITKVAPRIALLGPTGPDARAIMVEGESGILEMSKPDQRPLWEPSKKELTWPNGAKAFVYSGEEPDRLRGPQHHAAWVDEPAHIDLIEDCWSNLLFGLRLGKTPRICATTTPLPIPWIKELIADESTVSVVASTYANVHNLAPIFAKTILRRYEGTRKGRQEIHGEILADVEGALWKYEYFEGTRVPVLTVTLDRIVVAIDPAGTQRKKSDETGIIVIGVHGEDFYVLADYSGKYSPKGWADRAVAAYDTFSADAIVYETNYGGDMVTSTIENSLKDAAIKPRLRAVNSRRGKVIRADPIVALYEKNRVHHVGEQLGDLEDQLVSWIPGNDSPDRLDALVHGATDLAKIIEPAAVADPRTLRNTPTGNRLSLVRQAS